MDYQSYHAAMSKNSVLALLLLVLVAAAGTRASGPAPDQPELTAADPFPAESSSPHGELRLTGQFIKMLVLERQGHGGFVLKSPGSVVLLPEGNYRWQEVYLEVRKGLVYAAVTYERKWFRIARDTPVTLSIGGPLEPAIEVHQRGNKLVLFHYLKGADGEHYSAANEHTPPRFNVHNDGHRIGSGQFEYG